MREDSTQAHQVAARLADLRTHRPDAAQNCLAVRDLVVVCSSSRGGSSLFGEILRRSHDLLTFSAELNPHFMIPSLNAGGGCDAVADPAPYVGTDEAVGILRTELGADLGRGARRIDPVELARHAAWRLTMQWPQEAIELGKVADWVAACLRQLPSEQFDRQAFALQLLAYARDEHPAINPYRYDLPDDVVAGAFPDVAVPEGPTAEPVVEMAPFVLPRPWAPANATDAATWTAVATTPRNAFRLPLLQRVFPNARLRVIHLTRNPAAAVNGLRDGWRHRGFFSCHTDVPLRIDGYTDQCGPWATQWWNYDVPPSWRDWTHRTLSEVCAYQWRAAHEATLRSCAEMGVDVYRLHVEDLTGDPDRRWRSLEQLCAWLGIDPRPVAGDANLPVVMPTAPPRPRRWADNAHEFATVLADPQILDLAAELGYSREPAAWE